MELVKSPDQITLELRPLHGGSYTQLVLSGPVCTDPNPRTLHQFLSMFARWNCCPVDVVLSVDAQTASWSEVWTNVLASIPERHLEIRFQLPPSARPTTARKR